MRQLLLLGLCLILFSSCNDDDDNIVITTTNTVQLSNDDTLGSILTDANGNTLYFFSLDHTGTTSMCTGGCLDAWPIFYSETITVDTGLNTADFGAITHPNGEMQTTYKGWPLYYFANDNAPGDTNGENVGNVWFVAKPDYSVMYVEAQLIGRNANGMETNLIINEQGEYVSGDGLTFYIVDDRGNTLYAFSNDTLNTNNFTIDSDPNSDRNRIWPVAEIEGMVVPTVLNANDFSTIEIQGFTQLTYKGWPLYYFGQDENTRGNNRGVGFPAPGVWPIANLDLQEAPEPIANYSVPLSASNSIPFESGRVETGTANLTVLDNNTLRFNISIDDLSSMDNLTVAHVHSGDLVSTGGVVIGLVDAMNITFNGSTASGTIPVTQMQIDALAGDDVYINIHSQERPSGLVRGQIDQVISFAGNAILSPANEIPAVTGRNEEGIAYLRITEDGELFYRVIVNDLDATDSIVAGHIHSGDSTENGPVVVNLNITDTNLDTSLNITIDSMQESQVTTSDAYVNVHSSQVPSGLLRGQIE